jgi:hypothetical protein
VRAFGHLGISVCTFLWRFTCLLLHLAEPHHPILTRLHFLPFHLLPICLVLPPSPPLVPEVEEDRGGGRSGQQHGPWHVRVEQGGRFARLQHAGATPARRRHPSCICFPLLLFRGAERSLFNARAVVCMV